MKLITKNGELVLPEDFNFTIEQSSPVFSKEGTQTIPVDLPAAAINAVALDHPDRPGRISKYNRKLPAKLEAGVFHKCGHLVIETAGRKDGITGAIMINESDLYTQIKDVTLEDVFVKIERTDISGVENWYNRIYACMTGSVMDDFTAFPVAVNLDDGRYQFLNGPDTTSTSSPWHLKWETRKIFASGKVVNVPQGYGVTPFLWLWRMLELLFTDFDYTVRKNAFKTDDFLKKIVIINNTADSICKGSLNYADLVPTCTISEFMQWLEDKFLTHLYIYPESKMIDILPLQDVINSTSQLDITDILDGDEKYTFSEPSELSLSSDTSLSGSAPAAETLHDLARKYDHIAELSEPEFRNDAWKYSLVFRKSTGEYYEILRRAGDSSVERNKIGSNYFKHFTGRLQEKKYEASDLMPAMVEVKLGLNGSKELNVVCPYVGQSRHRNTSYNESGETAKQDIIVALSAGISDEDAIIEAKYNLGTTQKYNNLGIQWSTHDLTLQSLYDMFWKNYNRVLMNCSVEIQGKVDYSAEQLLSLRMDQSVLLKGQPCLIKQLHYSVGRKVANNKSEYVLLKSLTPTIDDIVISFSQQLYRWNYESNAATVFADFDSQEWENYTWEYINGTEASNSFEYIAPPTEQQYLSGDLFYQQSNDIRITATKINETQPYYFNRVLESGFRAVLIDS